MKINATITAYYARGRGHRFCADALQLWDKPEQQTDEATWLRAYTMPLTIHVPEQIDSELAAFSFGEQLFSITNNDQWYDRADFGTRPLDGDNARSLSVGDVLSVKFDDGPAIVIGVDTCGFRTM